MVIKVEREASARPTDQALEDYRWFFQNSRRVKKFAGEFVVVAQRRVVGHGTVREATESATASGALHPLLIDLRDFDKSGNPSADP